MKSEEEIKKKYKELNDAWEKNTENKILNAKMSIIEWIFERK